MHRTSNKEAVDKGGYLRLRVGGDEDVVIADLANQLALPDPSFWQVLGKARGWNNEVRRPDWKYHWRRFIDRLVEGKDAESYFGDFQGPQICDQGSFSLSVRAEYQCRLGDLLPARSRLK